MNDTTFVIEPDRQDIVISRTFDAPKEIVFKAVTDPAFMVRWWGPRKYETIVDYADIRPRGGWRFVHRDADGNEYAFKGVVHDIVPNEMMISTFEFEGMPGHVALETATFTESDGATTYTTQSVFQSLEDRDGMVASGMEGGSRESLDRLAELVKELR